MKASTFDAGEAVIQNALARQAHVQGVINKWNSPVQRFYEGSTVFVTGGSGFLGKQLIEKLFRSCKIHKVILLLRPKKEKAVEERLAAILKDALFDSLRIEQPNFADRIVIIIGDIADQDLGISETDRQMIIKEVTVIFHAAATINFQAPLRTATLVNVRGTRDLISLAKQCEKLRSFVHISTAYSHATFSRRKQEILEQFYPCPIDPQTMIQLAETLEEDRIDGITQGLIKDWPNTYSFTKALGEELVRSSTAELPICIIRPTVVMCARREPYTGWVEKSSIMGPNGLILGSTVGVIHALHTNFEVKIDLIPVDYVSNAAIVAAGTNQVSKIFTVGTSCRNHITWGVLSDTLHDLRSKITSPKAVWYCFALQSSNKWVFSLYNFLVHTIPAHLVDGVCVMLKKPPRLKKIYSMISKMSSAVSYYTNHYWIFKDSNTLELFNSLSESDKIIYHCNIADIEWEEQIALWQVGLRKFIVKDGLRNTAWALKKQLVFKMVTYIISGIFIYIFGLVFISLVMYFFGNYF